MRADRTTCAPLALCALCALCALLALAGCAADGPGDDPTGVGGTGTPSGSPPAEASPSTADLGTPSTAPTSTLAPVALPTTVAVEAGAGTVLDAIDVDGDVAVDDDPSFALGPDVVLDVDVARFPVDDAGQGGAPADGEGSADSPDPTEDGPIGGWAAVDRSLRSALVRPGNVAASVAVSIDGEIVHRAAFGDRDSATGDPAEPGDRFRIASISKTITAITALRLVEDGVIGLDDPVGRLVADHHGLGPLAPSTEGLTLRALLGHRSGFGGYEPTFFRRGAVDCADAARQGLARGAGSGGYVYSNMNYCVAGLMIEALTGRPYEEVAYREVLTPLGISGMRLAPTYDPGPDEVQHPITPGRNYMETLGAAGAWVATPSDLVTILDSLDASKPGWHPLRPETVEQLTVPPGGRAGQRGYGLGVISYGGGRRGHTGTLEETHAMVLDRGDGVTWAITVAGRIPDESTDLERIMNDAFTAGGFVG